MPIESDRFYIIILFMFLLKPVEHAMRSKYILTSITIYIYSIYPYQNASRMVSIYQVYFDKHSNLYHYISIL